MDGGLFGTPVGQWLTTTANYGGLVAGGYLNAQTPGGRMLAIAIGYAALAFILLKYLPRFRGGASGVAFVSSAGGRRPPNSNAA